MVVGGCALNMNGAEVELDSCWINEFSDASINQSGNNASISINSKSRLTPVFPFQLQQWTPLGLHRHFGQQVESSILISKLYLQQ